VALALIPARAGAALGVAKWEAGTCKIEGCNAEGKDPEAEFYTQAAGHPNFGITNFAFPYKEVGLTNAKEPEGKVKDVRVDLPPGLAVNPEAVAACEEKVIEEFNCAANSEVGEEEATGTAELVLGQRTTVTERFPVFNVVRRAGEPARFGVEVTSETLELAEGLTGHKLRSVIYLEGGLSWHGEAASSENSGVQSGDYHEFFRILDIPQEPAIVQSKLLFWGVPHEHKAAAPDNAFLTMPSATADCTHPQTTWLHVDSYEEPGNYTAVPFETLLENGTPLTATGCDTLAFNPSLSLKSENGQSDQPDGASVDLHVPQFTSEPSRPSSPDLQSAEIALPAGMTLNPSAAHGLQACTNAQIGIGSGAAVACPAGSKVGAVTIDAPGIPDGSLTGGLYLGTQESQDPESGREYRVFLAAEAPAYGVGLRLEGRVRANRESGRLTATFADNPQVPFEDVIVKFNGGARAPLANPLSCGAATPAGTLTPYGGAAVKGAASGFTVGSGSAAPCPAPLPFALTQSTQDQPSLAGAHTTFTFNLARGDGQQYISQVKTVLPPGLLGLIPTVQLCGEPQAAAGTCPAASEIGQASVSAGSGSEPYLFSGPVYLTGPYNGAPYGLSIAVPAVAGPFDLGTVVTRAQIGVETYTGRAVVTSALPSVFGGVPLRLRTVSVTVNRSNFMFNPTNCGALSTNSLLGSTFGASQGLASPFQVNECAKLAFKPNLSAFSDAKTTKLGGASLEVKIVQGPHEANLKEVELQLPKRLPSRLSTLQKACPAATFEAATPPGACPGTARVGTATVHTPVLPGALTGPAYLVSHGGEAFPDLDLILQGDGIEVVLVGHTHISNAGITTSTFESLPDVPITSAIVDLPTGPLSALTANGSLCRGALLAPTTLIAQSGAKLTAQTTIAVRGCPFAILSHRVRRLRALVKVRVPRAGIVTGGGRLLRPLKRRVHDAGTITLRVRLSHRGLHQLRAHHRLRIRLRLSFRPQGSRTARAHASTRLRFRLQ
jgi:hypothetical protein